MLCSYVYARVARLRVCVGFFYVCMCVGNLFKLRFNLAYGACILCFNCAT